MAPKRHPETAPERHPQKAQWQPPRGIRYDYRPERPKKPFSLIWRDASGQRKRQDFESETDREKIAKGLAEKREEHGRSILTFDPAEWRRWQQFKELVGGADPFVVAHEWLKAREGVGPASAASLNVSEAWQKVRGLWKEEKNYSDDTWRHLDTHIEKRFVGSFGRMRLNSITADHIREWLRKLTHPRTGQPMEELTKRHHRKDVNAFLDRCWREGMILRNPCELVIPPDTDDDGDVTVIPVRDAFEFFKANRDDPAAVRVALEAFGGLRFSTAARIAKENFNFDERGIEMPGAIHKSTKRKFRQGQPDSVWAWLDHANEATWAMTKRQYTEDKKVMLTTAGLRKLHPRTDEDRAKVRGLKNIWRHSFASYLGAERGELATVGRLMQHRHSSTTEKYEGVATKRDARLYLSITPASVLLTWEQFVTKFGLPESGVKRSSRNTP